MYRVCLNTLSAFVFIAFAAYLSGCGCGFDCNNGNNDDDGPAVLSLGFSDSLPEELKQVVIEVDSITFGRSGADDLVVETFTIAEQGLTDSDTFQIDLLQYQGVKQLLVISDLQIDSGSYSELSISIVDSGINHSYVQEADDSLVAIEVSGNLNLSGLALSSGAQAFTVEFGLAQALQFQSTPNTYLLSETGIRVENTELAARLSGDISATLFDAVAPCDAKTDPDAGNRVYLYEGTNLSTDGLADVFTDSSQADVPEGAIAPFAVANLLENEFTGEWNYAFGYLPAGSYTMAFACDTEQDDAVEFDGLIVPLPTDQVYEVDLSEGQTTTCNLDTGASC